MTMNIGYPDNWRNESRNKKKEEQSSSVKAVVILFGWLGAQKRHVQKYVNLYTQKECIVIYGTADVYTIMNRNESKLTQMVIDTVQKAAPFIISQKQSTNDNSSQHAETINTKQQEPNHDERAIPVIIHYFSNGGAFVAERMEQMIREAQTFSKISSSKEEENSGDNDTILGYRQDILTVSQHLECEIIDSAPAYMHKSTFFKAIDAAIPKNNLLRIFVKTLASIQMMVFLVLDFIFQREALPQLFWRHMMESNLCQQQVFIYSTLDQLTDYHKIDELIEVRKKKLGKDNVIAHKLEDSEHVLHYRKHPKLYESMIHNVLTNK